MFCLFIFHVLEKVLLPHRHQHNTSLLYHYLICSYKKHLCVCFRNLHFQINLETIRSSRRRTESYNLLCCDFTLFFFVSNLIFINMMLRLWSLSQIFPRFLYFVFLNFFFLSCWSNFFSRIFLNNQIFFRLWIYKFFSLLLRPNTFKSAEWRKKNLKCESIAIESFFVIRTATVP